MKQPTLADLKRISEPDTTTTTVTSMANLRRAVAIAESIDKKHRQSKDDNLAVAEMRAEREAAMVDKAAEVLKNLQGDRCFCEYDSSQLTDYPMDDHSGECKAATKLLAEVAEMRNQEAGE